MKNFGKSFGLSLLLGIGASIIPAMFIEGWGSLVATLVCILSFCGAGFIVEKMRPKSLIYAGVAIATPFWLGFLPRLV